MKKVYRVLMVAKVVKYENRNKKILLAFLLPLILKEGKARRILLNFAIGILCRKYYRCC